VGAMVGVVIEPNTHLAKVGGCGGKSRGENRRGDIVCRGCKDPQALKRSVNLPRKKNTIVRKKKAKARGNFVGHIEELFSDGTRMKTICHIAVIVALGVFEKGGIQGVEASVTSYSREGDGKGPHDSLSANEDHETKGDRIKECK